MTDSTDDLKQIYADIEAKISELEGEIRKAMAQAITECSTRPKSIPEPATITLDIGKWMNNSSVMQRIQKHPLNQTLSLAARVAADIKPAPPTN